MTPRLVFSKRLAASAIAALLILLCHHGVSRAGEPDAPGIAMFTPLTKSSRMVVGTLNQSHAAASAPGLQLRVDADAVRSLRSAAKGRVILPLAGGKQLALSLTRNEVLSPGAVVTATGADGPTAVHTDLVLYRGTVDGDPASWVVLGFTGDEVLGVVESHAGRFAIGPDRSGGSGDRSNPPLHVLSDVRDLTSAGAGFECHADEFAPPVEHERSQAPGSPTIETTTTRLVCNVAIDCDYEFYANKFGSNLTNATNYILTLMGVVSAIYERDVNVTLNVSYFNIWTTSSDPYTQVSTLNLLNEFTTYWNANRTGVSRDIAHLVSGRDSVSSGMGYIDVLCDLANAYGVSPLYANSIYPSNTTTWDAVALAHEMGHNFGSYHTQNCFWQANGYTPPGTLLDSCWTAEGTCYSGPTGILPANKGTLMSYCHLVAGVANGLRLEFHSACRSIMRQRAESCLDAASVQPPMNVAVTVTNGAANLSWTATTTPGVIRYDIHRSSYTADPAPPLIGSTTGTTYADANALGACYFSVCAVTNTGISPMTGEVRADVCAPTGPTTFASGTAAISPVVGDFNEDGIPDLVVANNNTSGIVEILLGQGTGGLGNGSFAAPIPYPCGTKPAAMVTGDFNEDGITDLVTANNYSTGTLSILLGQGSGGVGNGAFGAPATVTVGSNPMGLAVGDFNEDGILDLAVADSASNSVSILRGAGSNGVGNGSFLAPVNYGVDAGPTAVAAGDFNQDGITDLAVVGGASGTVGILMGRGIATIGDGTFAAPVTYPVGSGGRAIATGDFNEDGITDLVVPRNQVSGSVAVLLGRGSGGHGDGTFAAAVSYACGPSPTALAVCDFNGNGVADLLVTNGVTGGTVSVLLGRGSGCVGDGTFDPPQALSVGKTPQGIACCDLNEDGIADAVLTMKTGTPSTYVFLGRCAAPATTGVTVLTPNGGELCALGTDYSVSWTKGEAVESVAIDISRDNGLNWETLATHQTGTSFRWSVTPPTGGSSTARIRVSDTTVPCRADASNANFRIMAPSLATSSPVPTALALRGIFPNPARERLTVSFALPRPGPAILELVDVAGRRVAQREVGMLGPGDHTIVLTPHPPLSSGVYLVRLRSGSEQTTSTAVVTR